MRYLFVITLFLFSYSNAFAIKQYRCNGRVQYSPCSENSTNKPFPTYGYSRPRYIPEIPPTQHGIRGERYAEVIEQHFKKLPPDRGHWSGKFRGNGFVELTLEGLKKGTVVHTQYMGGLWLKNKPSTYSYKGPLPKGTILSWRVIARAS